MRFDRRRHGADCNHCPYREHNKIFSEGPIHAKVVVIGEAPGADEDLKGLPFVGPAGGILNEGLREAGIGRANTWVTNTICCRPQGNDIHSAEAQEAIQRCRPGLDEELDFLSHERRVYIPTGNVALRALGLEDGILQKRGSIYDEGDKLIVPTMHPSYIMRGNWSKKPIFVADLTKAKEVSADGWTPPKEHFNIRPTMEELEHYAAKHTGNGWCLAVDIETTGLKPGSSDIVCIGFAADAEHALCVPFLKRGGHHYWPNGEQNRMEAAVRHLLINTRTMFQNAVFDVPYLAGKGFPVKHIEHDTLLLHSVIDSDLPHNLGFITSVYGSTPYWKERFKRRAGGILSLDDDTLRTYNLRDCVVLHQVYPPMMKDLRDDGLEQVYAGQMELLPVINKMSQQGLKLDKKALRDWKKNLGTRQAALERRLRLRTKVHSAFSFESKDDLRLLIHGFVAPKYSKATAAHSKRQDRYGHFISEKKEESAARIRASAAYAKDLNTTTVLTTTRVLWSADVEVSRLTGKTFRPAVDDQALLSLQLKAQNRQETVGKFRKPTPAHRKELRAIKHFLRFLETYREWAETTKLLSTYTTFTPDPDGRVRASFALHRARTGRLTSQGPNFQNQPQESRKIFTAAEGNVFIERDYSNLELRVLAYISGDEQSIADFDAGLNVHTENTKRMWQLDEEDPLWDLARRATKTYIFGRNYGGSLHGIYEKVIMQVPSLGLTFARFKEQDERYRKAHPQEASWRDRQSQLVEQTMVSHDAFGGRRVYRGGRSEAVREGLNQPIQGTAARIISKAMVKLDEALAELQDEAFIVNQVHDSLLVECKEGLSNLILESTRYIMEAPVAINGQDRSFPTDAKSGTCWGTLK